MNRLKVKVTGPHTHAGRVIPIGEVIEVPAKVARLMAGVWKTAEPVDWPTKKKASKKRAEKDS